MTSSLEYYHTNRHIFNGKIILEKQYDTLLLTEDMIKAKHTCYKLSRLKDLNFRRLSVDDYYFYLYTASGVVTFFTEEYPQPFVDAIRKQMIN